MSGRKKVSVNELLIQQMIADVNTQQVPSVAPVPVKEEDASELPEADNKVASKEMPKAGRKKQPGYEELYLTYVPVCVNNRQQVYIEGELYDKYARFLRVVSRKMSITAYINNILQQHWEDNKDVMNELYVRNLNNPL